MCGINQANNTEETSVKDVTSKWMAVGLCLWLMAGSAVAGVCELDMSPPAASPEKIHAFDRKVLTATDAAAVGQVVEGSVCRRESVYAYLTKEPGYGYASCFIAKASSDSFWSSNHDEGERLLARMGRDCIAWARKRYAPTVALIAKNAEREAERAKAEAKAEAEAKVRAEAEARQQAEATARARAEEQRRQREEQFKKMLTNAGTGLTAPVIWGGPVATAASAAAPSATPTAARPDGEMLAYLFGWTVQHGGASVAELLPQWLGTPRVKTAVYDAKAAAYRLHIVASGADYALDAWVAGQKDGEPGSDKAFADMQPWVLFERTDHGLTPRAVVLQSEARVASSQRIEGAPVQTASVDAKVATVTLTGAADREVTLEFICAPHGGGTQPLPLRRCLNDGGYISLLTATGFTRADHEAFDAKVRIHSVKARAPFAVLARTGDRNNANMLTFRVLDPQRQDNPESYRREAIGREASLFARAP